MRLNVEAIWKSVCLLQGREELLSENFFSTLSSAYPELYQWVENLSPAQRHNLLVSYLNPLVACMAQPDALIYNVHSLGRSIRESGLSEENAREIGDALLGAINLTLGENWSPNHRAAWMEALEVIYGLLVPQIEEYAEMVN